MWLSSVIMKRSKKVGKINQPNPIIYLESLGVFKLSVVPKWAIPVFNICSFFHSLYKNEMEIWSLKGKIFIWIFFPSMFLSSSRFSVVILTPHVIIENQRPVGNIKCSVCKLWFHNLFTTTGKEVGSQWTVVSLIRQLITALILGRKLHVY